MSFLVTTAKCPYSITFFILPVAVAPRGRWGGCQFISPIHFTMVDFRWLQWSTERDFRCSVRTHFHILMLFAIFILYETNVFQFRNVFTANVEHHVLLVQGNAESFPRWSQIASNIQTLTLIYASYDRPVGRTACPNDCHFVPNTSWTDGRNLLTKFAFCKEQHLHMRFKYWIFADDDIVLRCTVFESEIDCWRKYIHFLSQDIVIAPTVAVARESTGPIILNQDLKVFLTDSYDAILNAFHRRHIPVLLPYVDHPPDVSWWISQAMHFRVMRSCFKELGLIPSIFSYINPEHRGYPTGRDVDLEKKLIDISYGPYGILPPALVDNEPFGQFDYVSGPHSLHDAFGIIKSTLAGAALCSFSKQRFENFVQTCTPGHSSDHKTN